MKRVSWLVLISILIFSPRAAMARDFCLNFGAVNPTELIFKAFTVPGKGACKTVLEVVPSIPGLNSIGAACTTTDGKTLLFTLSDGLGGIETIQGSVALPAGSGMANDCFAADSQATSCLSDTIAITTCAKKAPPITDVLSGSLTSRRPLLAR